MRREPIEKGRLLKNPTLAADVGVYGVLIGVLALINFVIVAFLDGPGVAHTHECNTHFVAEVRLSSHPPTLPPIQ